MQAATGLPGLMPVPGRHQSLWPSHTAVAWTNVLCMREEAAGCCMALPPQAPKPSPGPHKTRECLPLLLILRNRLK